MKTFNRVLYIICAVCIAITAVLFLITIWAEIDAETMWKSVASSFILLSASGAVLVLNLCIAKMKSENGRKKQKTEQADQSDEL